MVHASLNLSARVVKSSIYYCDYDAVMREIYCHVNIILSCEKCTVM